MKIEKPDWQEVCSGKVGTCTTEAKGLLNDWFQEHVEPVNKMLSEAVEVACWKSDEHNTWCSDETVGPNNECVSHKALLINIQPIRKDSAEDILRDLCDLYRHSYGSSFADGIDQNELRPFIKRAKKVLNED